MLQHIGRRGFVAILAFLLASSTGSGQPAPEGRLFYWGFDKVSLRVVKADGTKAVPVRLATRIQTIVALSIVDHVAAIAGRERPSNHPAIFLLDWPSTTVTRTLEREAYQVALAPSAPRLAFSTLESVDNEDYMEVRVHDLETDKEAVVARREGLPGSLSWSRDSTTLTFDYQHVMNKSVNRMTGDITRSLRSSIESVDLAGRATPLFDGSAPAWSPDGRTMAYRGPRTVFLYDAIEKKTSTLYHRRQRQKDLVGNIYWSPSGHYLALNAPVGVMDQGLECLVIEVRSAKATSLGNTSYTCGPWLDTTASSAPSE